MAVNLLIGLLVSAIQPNCTDGYSTDRCDPVVQAKMLEDYGAKAAAAFDNPNADMRRVFFIDGYGRDIILIEAVRVGEAEPEITIYSRVFDRPATSHFTAPLSQRQWDRVIRQSENLDRAIYRAPTTDEQGEELFYFCLHGWHYWGQSVSKGKIVNSVENSCNTDSVVERLAWDLADIALDAMPECAALDEANYVNDATRLRFCLQLGGDRLAMAQAMNDANPILFDHFHEGTTRAIDFSTASRLVIEEDELTAAKFVRTWQGIHDAEKEVSFGWNTVTATNADTAVITGLLHWNDEIETVEGKDRFKADGRDVTFILRRDSSDAKFRLDEVSVGPEYRYIEANE
ncbi:hypothetical protein [Sphingomicrobium flavum]|uniref:hypothetical protein n=1 Tax=Sphingomicrobium flavum TaxID=1229164 RepID=UPI0021AD7621|nr:hypothetical protein [Sphingomicrobium flavum]